ncbi:MAG: transposase [Coleofasciculus sp. G1-WW12-02]|uniref:RNA-guided endonuclease TnpB family protein n=1 Tax=Coleofasciculus sp. G1-WW12-02 TaxID=3068483 RepID=UPI0032F6F9C0
MPSKSTPTFITEISLVASDTEEKLLLVRLEAGRQVYNACLGEAMRRVKLIRQSKGYQFAAGLPRTANNKPNKARSEAFRKAWNAHDFSDYSIQGYAIGIRQSWIGEHIDADTAQKLGTRAFRAARNVLLGRAKRVRFKGHKQMDSLEGKSKRSPMKWQKETFIWKGIQIKPLINYNDPVILHGLNAPVKYVRLVRRKFNGRNRFYVQLVNEGKPFQKPKNTITNEVVGADIGPSTIAVVGESEAFLKPFCSKLADKSKEIARLQRQMSRQQRANNPDCFEPSRCDLPKPGQKHGKRKLGKSIKGKRQTNQSNRYAKTKQRKANIERKLSAHRKSLQGELVNKVLSIGKFINIEKLSYRAFQKMFGASVGRRAPGMFVERLRQKAENAGGYVNEFPTQTTKLSQRCVCGCIKKKPLSQRVHTCKCGVVAQRDLFSANLARYVDVDGCYQAEAALDSFLSVDSLLWSAWQQAGNLYKQSSIGNPRIVNVVAVTAGREERPRSVIKLDKMLDDVGNAESQQKSS